MKKINLNKFKGAKFCFNFQALEKLDWYKDSLELSSDNQAEIHITTDTNFSLKEVSSKDFKSFLKENEKYFEGQEFLKASKYKKEYVYENDVMKFNAIGCFVRSLVWSDLDMSSDIPEYQVEFIADIVLLHVKDMKEFMRKYQVNLGIQRKNDYFCK
jgi:hypothetical protein